MAIIKKQAPYSDGFQRISVPFVFGVQLCVETP